MADQVIVSLAHFIMGLSVARGGDAVSLGLFGIVIIVTSTSGDLHRAVIWLPMTHGDNPADFRVARRLSLLLAMSLGSVAAVCAVLLRAIGHVDASRIAGALVVLVPLLTLHEIHRRIQFARLNASAALAADCLYAVTAVTGILLLPAWTGSGSAAVLRAITAWTLAGIVGSVFGAALLNDLPAAASSVRQLVRKYSPASRAYSINAFLIFGSQRASMLIIAGTLGTAALGNVEAARLLTAPLMVGALGVASVIVPVITHEVRHKGLPSALQITDRIAVAGLIVAVVYGVGIVLSADVISRAAFESIYRESGVLAFVFSGIAGTSLAATAIMTPLGVSNRAAAVPWSRLPGVVAVLSLSYPVALAFGEVGVVALVLGEGVLTLVLLRRAVARVAE